MGKSLKPLITVVIPVLIQERKVDHRDPETLLATTEKSIDLLYRNTAKPFNLLIIDHGSMEEAETCLRNLPLQNLTYVKHKERARGMVEAINEAWKTIDTDLLAFMHNDFYILEDKWDLRVIDLASSDPKLGIIGFGGGYGMGPDGYRFGFASNMVDANVHGVHRWEGWMPAVVLDGMIMIMSRKMLDAVQGIPTEYKIHHYYDLHMSLASVYAGFHNYVLFIRCQHISGQTLMAPELDGMKMYQYNKKVFLRRWSSKLPVYVTSNFSLRQGIPPKITHDSHYFPRLPKIGL